jgi:hypothetical protein
MDSHDSFVAAASPSDLVSLRGQELLKACQYIGFIVND